MCVSMYIHIRRTNGGENNERDFRLREQWTLFLPQLRDMSAVIVVRAEAAAQRLAIPPTVTDRYRLLLPLYSRGTSAKRIDVVASLLPSLAI